MYLHCEVCALRRDDEYRLSDQSRLGKIVMPLSLPLHGGMIGSPNEARGVPAPFPRTNDWRDFVCPRCRSNPFVIDQKDISRFAEQGGPDRVLTDDGFVDLAGSSYTHEAIAKIRDAGNGGHVECPKCGKSYKNTEAGLRWYAKHAEKCDG
jgi:hypothetical protein